MFSREEISDRVDDEIAYFDFREIAWLSAGIAECHTFSSRCLNFIKELVAAAPEKILIIIDFTGVDSLLELNSLPKTTEQFTPPHDKSILYWGLSIHEAGIIRNCVGKNGSFVGSGEDARTHGIFWRGNFSLDTTTEYLIDLHQKRLTKENDQVKKIILSTFERFASPEILSSTPVRTNGVFNSQRIIGASSHFARATLSLEREYSSIKKDLLRIFDEQGFERTRFLALSLRASPFVGALSILCDQGFNILAPGVNSRVLNEFVANPLSPRVNYIFVADFIVGGMELRVAEAFAAHRQSTVSHCICLGTYLAPEVYNSNSDIKALVHLERECPDLKFNIAGLNSK
jgi:hypothetical protein